MTTSSRPDLTARILTSIDEIDENTWDQLAADENFWFRHRFARLCELSGIEDASYRHVLISDSQGLAATASLTFMSAPLDALAPRWLRSMVRSFRREHDGLLRMPAVFCGLPVSLGQSPVAFRADSDRRSVIAKLDDLMRDFAQDQGSAIMVFKELAESDASHCEVLKERGFNRLSSLPYHSLDIRWNSLDEYIRSLRSGYRRQIRHDASRARSAGLILEHLDNFSGECRHLYNLYLQIMGVTDNWLEILPMEFFDLLARTFSAQSRALLLRFQGRIVYSAILLQSGRELTFLLAGIDRKFDRAYHAYPYLLLMVIKDAIESGAVRVNLGQTSDYLKSRFGSTISGRSVYLRHKRQSLNRLIHSCSSLLFPDRTGLDRRVFNQRSDSDPGCVPWERSGRC